MFAKLCIIADEERRQRGIAMIKDYDERIKADIKKTNSKKRVTRKYYFIGRRVIIPMDALERANGTAGFLYKTGIYYDMEYAHAIITNHFPHPNTWIEVKIHDARIMHFDTRVRVRTTQLLFIEPTFVPLRVSALLETE